MACSSVDPKPSNLHRFSFDLIIILYFCKGWGHLSKKSFQSLLGRTGYDGKQRPTSWVQYPHLLMFRVGSLPKMPSIPPGNVNRKSEPLTDSDEKKMLRFFACSMIWRLAPLFNVHPQVVKRIVLDKVFILSVLHGCKLTELEDCWLCCLAVTAYDKNLCGVICPPNSSEYRLYHLDYRKLAKAMMSPVR